MFNNGSKQLILLSSSYFIFVFCSLAVIGVLSLMSSDISASTEDLAGLITSFSMSYAATAICAPLFIKRFTSRDVLITGLVGITLGSLALAAANNLLYAHIARVVQGASAALIGPTASTIAFSLAAPENRGRALGLVFAGTTVAMVLGVPVALYIGSWSTWRLVYLLIAVISALCALISLFSIPKGEAPSSALTFSSFVRKALSPIVSLTLLTTFFRLAAQFAFYTLIGRVLVEYLGFSISVVGLILFGYGVAGVVGAFISGPVVDRLGAIKSLRGINLLTLVAFFWLVQLNGTSAWYSVALSFFFWGVVGLMFSTPQQKFLSELEKTDFSAVLSLNAAFLYIGMAAGGVVAAKVASTLGLHALAWAGLILVTFSIATSELGFFVARRQEGI